MTKSNMMRLWTIQTKEIWARTEKSGVLECNELHIDADKAIDSWLRPAYDWMVGQLEQRVKNKNRLGELASTLTI